MEIGIALLSGIVVTALVLYIPLHILSKRVKDLEIKYNMSLEEINKLVNKLKDYDYNSSVTFTSSMFKPMYIDDLDDKACQQ